MGRLSAIEVCKRTKLYDCIKARAIYDELAQAGKDTWEIISVLYKAGEIDGKLQQEQAWHKGGDLQMSEAIKTEMRQFERLEDIHHKFITSDEYADMPEVVKARDKFLDLIEQLPDSIRSETEDAYGDSIYRTEIQGFVYGFRYATQLMAECMP